MHPTLAFCCIRPILSPPCFDPYAFSQPHFALISIDAFIHITKPTSLDSTVIIWLLLFNCDSELGVAKPENPVLALWEHENIVGVWQFISFVLLKFSWNHCAANLCGLENYLAYMLYFGSMVQKWCEKLLFLIYSSSYCNSILCWL